MTRKTRKRVCVFSSASDAIDPHYFRLAAQLGRAIGKEGYDLVYGGSRLGLMGEVARSAHRYGAKVTAVIPELLHRKSPPLEVEHEVIVTPDLRERKTAMERRSDIFIGLPGGFGTLEELLEVITLKQLRYHSKPIAILNARGFYDPLIALFEQIYSKNFAKRKAPPLYQVFEDVDSLAEALRKGFS